MTKLVALKNGTEVFFKVDVEGTGKIIDSKIMYPKMFGEPYISYVVEAEHREARYNSKYGTNVLFLDDDQVEEI